MIVYFFKKSKKQYKKWGSGLLVYILAIYAMYVGIQITYYDQKTIQIMRESEANQQDNNSKTDNIDSGVQEHDFLFVASKRGKYYYPIKCKKAQGLSPKNMLYFKDKMSAEKAGYIPILGC